MAARDRAEPTEWDKLFERHVRRFRRVRRLMRALPTDPRCKICASPFRGIGGRIVRPFGYGPSRKNPSICDVCMEEGPDGGFHAEAGVLFADVRGFTRLASERDPAETAALLNRFYGAATAALFRHDAIVDKLVGDQVMALFWPPIVDGDARAEMVAAAEELLRGVGYGSPEGAWLDVGVGIDFGPVYMGNVGGGEVRDFTAVGDVVNVASRLQATARGGEIVVSAAVYAGVADRYRAAPRSELELKGKAEAVPAYTLAVVEASASAASVVEPV